MLRSSRLRIGAALGILLIPAILALAHRGNGLNGASGLGSAVTAVVRPGEDAEFQTSLLNRSGSEVRLQSATLLPLPGFQSPRLTSVFVQGASGRSPLEGYQLPAGVRVQIRYSVAAPAPGDYASNGLSTTALRADGSRESVTVSSVAGTCVQALGARCPPAFVTRLQDAARDEVHGGSL